MAGGLQHSGDGLRHFGGALGGFLAQHVGDSAVFVFAAGLAAAWFMLAASMQAPPAVRTRMFHVEGEVDEARGRKLSAALSRIDGVVEAIVIAAEGVAYLKVRMGEWDEAGARILMNKGG